MHDVRKFVRVEEFRHHHGVAAVAEHPDFHGGDLAILRQHFKLLAQLRARRVVDRFDALGVLNRQRGDRRNAVAAVRGESFQVGGGARAAGWIETRDGQQDGRRRMIMSVRTHRLFLLEERKWPVASEKRTGNCECTRVSSPAQQKTSEKFSVASLAEGAQSFLGFWVSVDTLRKIRPRCRMPLILRPRSSENDGGMAMTML